MVECNKICTKAVDNLEHADFVVDNQTVNGILNFTLKPYTPNTSNRLLQIDN